MSALPRRIGKAIVAMLCGMALLYVLLIATLHIPAVQRQIASALAEGLSRRLHTEVSIRRVNLGFLNRLIIDDLSLRDAEEQPLLYASRIAVSLNPTRLLRGDIEITTLQLFGLRADLRRADPESPLNCQFLLDALSSEADDSSSMSVSLAIHSLLVRHASLSYTVLSDTLPPLHISDLALTATLHQEEDGEIDLRLKRLSLLSDIADLQLSPSAVSLAHGQLTSLTLTQPRLTLSAGQVSALCQRLGGTGAMQVLGMLPECGGIDITAPSLAYADGRWQLPQLTATLAPTLATLTADLALTPADSTLALTDIHLTASNLLLPSLAHLSDSTTYGAGVPLTLTGNARLSAPPTATPFLIPHSSFLIDLALSAPLGQATLQASYSPSLGLQATAEATITDLALHGYTYPPICLQATTDGHTLEAQLSTTHPDLDLALSAECSDIETLLTGKEPTGMSGHIEGRVHALNPHALGFARGMSGELLSTTLHADFQGENYRLTLDSLALATADTLYHLRHLALAQTHTDSGYTLTADGDFIDLSLLSALPLPQLIAHLPDLPPAEADLTLTDAALVRHLLPIDLSLDKPLHLSALTTPDSLFLALQAAALALNGTSYRDISLHALRTHGAGPQPLWAGWTGSLSLIRDTGAALAEATLTATSQADTITTHLRFAQQADTDIKADLHARIIPHAYSYPTAADWQEANALTIQLLPSTLSVADTLWHITPAHITLADRRYSVDDLTIASDNAQRMLAIAGSYSPLSTDTLSVTLKGIQIPYIADLANFHAVRLRGDIYGTATVTTDPGDHQPRFAADLNVPNFHLETAPLGAAHITAYYDPLLPGIWLDADIRDEQSTPLRRTTCQGYVAPANDDILLHITARHTNAAFLEDYLGSIFSNMHGEANGTIDVVGPLREVNLVGDISTDVTMTLRPTNVTYHVDPADTIRLRPYAFRFENIRLHDSQGGSALCNGQVTHRNVKDFSYTLDAQLNRLIAYQEHQFNTDKFMGDVTVDGSLHIAGSDGHPLHINAEVTPAPHAGSFFAYDAATPDAISTADFITFGSPTPDTESLSPSDETEKTQGAAAQKRYTSDIFMDIAVHLTPDCAISLRMDQQDDAYIHTYGNGELLAHYHNKSPFTLQGTYNISSGSYRLYLQDLIYRDLSLQSGSSVNFNGNPFDANIHLICHHTLPAVPLSDLTADASVTSTGRAKVVCILDITGQLDNMNLDFDYQLPNETEETKQLVKSLIYTDEERNMQMVYLLALGRFYSSEYARATGQADNSQAVNSLLTSTISGQLNQMISSLIGKESNWQFGTGISTGDYGLEDLDIEGILTGRLFNDRLLINGNFGYRDNALTQNASFIGDFDLSWRLTPNGNTFLKAYNKANDRYFTKNALNTQGIGISWQKDFEHSKKK